MSLSKPAISECRTHHVDENGNPIYKERYTEVLAYHQVGNNWIAAIQMGNMAFHISIDGKPIYKKKFFRCFGFYFGFAAVIDGDGGWYHINPNGDALYDKRFEFVGNYQENMVVVADSSEGYYHLDAFGKPLYKNRWAYCGDFRDGMAVVQSRNGLSSHIKKDGSLLHGKWFIDLDVYHKGFARAKTDNGWCHVDKLGNPIYRLRFATIEPFYNGLSRCETIQGDLVVINESGVVLRQLRNARYDYFAELSADMVGYWKTFTISTAVELGVFDNLPATINSLAKLFRCNQENLFRLMRALHELGLVCFQNNAFYGLTEKGAYLSRTHPMSLANASKEYAGDLLQRWTQLPANIKNNDTPKSIFAEVAADKKRVITHHQMLSSYALHDYSEIVASLPIVTGDIVFDAGGGIGVLAKLIRAEFSNAKKVILGDLLEVLNQSNYDLKFELDFLKPWNIHADKIIFARVLHDWPDKEAIIILRNAKQALNENGEILILEMLLDETIPSGSLSDLHLLAVTGGKERDIKQFRKLAAQADMKVLSYKKLPSLVSLIVMVANEHI